MMIFMIIAMCVTHAEPISRMASSSWDAVRSINEPFASREVTRNSLKSPLTISGHWNSNESFAIDIEGEAINKRIILRPNTLDRIGLVIDINETFISTSGETVTSPKRFAKLLQEKVDQQLKDKLENPPYQTDRLMEETGGRPILRSAAHGTYLRAWDKEQRTDGPESNVDMTENKTSWTHWNIEHQGFCAKFKSIHSPTRFLRAHVNGSVDLFKNETMDWSCLLPIRNDDGTWSFLSTDSIFAPSKFLSAKQDGNVVMSIKTGKSERFWVDKWSEDATAAQNEATPSVSSPPGTIKITLDPRDQAYAKITGHFKDKRFVLEISDDTTITTATYGAGQTGRSFNIVVNEDQTNNDYESAKENRDEIIHTFGEQMNSTRLWAEIGRGDSKLRSVHGTCLRIGDRIENSTIGYKAKMATCTQKWHFEDDFVHGQVTLTAVHKSYRGSARLNAGSMQGGSIILSDTVWEPQYWIPFKNDDGSWSFYSYHGQWLSASANGTVSTVEYCGTNEHFYLDK